MIQLIDVCKIYQSVSGVRVEATKHIDLELPDVGLIFILGKSGSGKSTLLNLIAGLDQVSSGTILINDKNISSLSPSESSHFRNHHCGFVFQDFNIIDAYTVVQNLKFVGDIQGLDYKDEQIKQSLSEVGLDKHAHHLGSELSGGQKQRLAIARALIKNPDLILADEPTGNLDNETAENILNLLQSISKHKLVLVVSHDEEDALKYGDRIIHIKDGLIHSDKHQNKTEIYNKEFIEEKRFFNPLKSLQYGWMQIRHRLGQSLMTLAILSICLLMLFLLESYLSFIQNPIAISSTLFTPQDLNAISLQLQTVLSADQSFNIRFILYAIIVSVCYVVYSSTMDARIKEFAIYKALGASHTTIFSLLISESILYVFIALILGSLGSIMYLFNLNFHFFLKESILQIHLSQILFYGFILLTLSFLLNILLYVNQHKKYPLMQILKGD